MIARAAQLVAAACRHDQLADAHAGQWARGRVLVIDKDSPLLGKYCYCSRLLPLNALNSYVLGLNAGITGLLPSYGVNSQALMQNGMKSQAIWKHSANSHVI